MLGGTTPGAFILGYVPLWPAVRRPRRGTVVVGLGPTAAVSVRAEFESAVTISSGSGSVDVRESGSATVVQTEGSAEVESD